MIGLFLSRWKSRRELSAIAAKLQAENEQLRIENRRLDDSLLMISSAALNVVNGEKVFLDTWCEDVRKEP